MADNIAITEGSGATIATDQVGGAAHYQRVKISDGADGGSEHVSASSANGLEVDITRIQAGDNNIGNVDIVTIPARDRTTDNIGVAQQTDAIMSDTTALTPKFAAIDVASSGDNTIVAAVAGKKIRVVNLVLISAGTVNVRFESGAGGTALTGQMNLVANTGFAPGFDPTGHFETASNTLLNIELSAAISVDGWLKYVEV